MGEEGQQQGVKEGQQCLCYTDSPAWPWPKCCLVVLEQDVFPSMQQWHGLHEAS